MPNTKIVAKKTVTKNTVHLSQDLSAVAFEILCAEKHRRIALQYKITEISNTLIDAELRRREEKAEEESAQRIKELLSRDLSSDL